MAAGSLLSAFPRLGVGLLRENAHTAHRHPRVGCPRELQGFVAVVSHSGAPLAAASLSGTWDLACDYKTEALFLSKLSISKEEKGNFRGASLPRRGWGTQLLLRGGRSDLGPLRLPGGPTRSFWATGVACSYRFPSHPTSFWVCIPEKHASCFSARP